MRQFVPSGRDAVERGIRAFGAVHSDLVRVHRTPLYVTRRHPATSKVALLSGGGSGHEPLHAGFVGVGMLDAAVPGQVFASPSAEQVHRATVAAHAGRGVLHLVKNYTGDVINFGLGADLARADGVDVATVIVDDDVASGERGGTPGRRGVAGTVLVEKVCGAAAERGMPLGELAELGTRVVDATRSIGVAIEPGTAYGADRPSFDLAVGEVEFGVGIHGERSAARGDFRDLDELCGEMADVLLRDDERLSGDVVMLVNGLGRTTPLELYAAFDAAASALSARGGTICRAMVGNLVTSLDMRGFSITLSALSEDLLPLWDDPAVTPAWTRPNPSRPLLGESADSEGDDEGAGARETVPTAADSAVAAALGSWVDRFADRAESEAPRLGELDRVAGDGDFGATLQTVIDRFREASGATTTGSAMTALARVYAGVGGTSGPMLSAWLLSLDAALRAGGLTGEALAAGLSQGVSRVRLLGGASVGDKTMVDAMVPAAEAADSAASEGFSAALAAAARAARDGAEATAGLVARRGRASYVGAAAAEVADPGAMLIAIVLEEGAAAWEG